jgi:hypothetical protein
MRKKREKDRESVNGIDVTKLNKKEMRGMCVCEGVVE